MVQNNNLITHTAKLIDKDQQGINLLAHSVLNADFTKVVTDGTFSYEISYYSGGRTGVIDGVVIGKRSPYTLDGSRLLNGSVLLSS